MITPEAWTPVIINSNIIFRIKPTELTIWFYQGHIAYSGAALINFFLSNARNLFDCGA